jgi:hypothetical protein
MVVGIQLRLRCECVRKYARLYALPGKHSRHHLCVGCMCAEGQLGVVQWGRLRWLNRATWELTVWRRAAIASNVC